jgi:glycolate dehydrogenase iron-sulfur subunit
MDISAYYDEIAHCNRCGFCQTACPIFRSTGHESGVARGRLALLRAIIEDRLDWSRELEEPLFDCLLCGACTANCFPAIPTSDLMVRARNEYLEKVGRKSIHRLLFDHLLPYPRRLHLAARAVAVGKNARLTDVARALGLLRMFGRDFTAITDIIDQFPERPFRDKNRPGEYRGEGRNLRIAYFVGCGVDIIQQEGAAATLALLRKIGRNVTVLDNCCCGLPAQSYGDLEVARKLASKNLETLSNRTADVIVTDCSSCTSFLKKYPDLFEADDPQKTEAKKVAAKVRDLVEFVADVSLPKLTSTQGLRVTYHDPCHASRGQNISREPREILKSIQGVTYVELPEADWCCGGAGAYAVSHQELAGKVLDRKMENVKKTAADLLLTSCPACMIQLAQGVRKHGLSTRVGHISQIMNGL